MIRSLESRLQWCLDWRVRRRALTWVLKFQEGEPTPAERAEFMDWFGKDLTHQRAFRFAWLSVALTEATVAELGSELLSHAPRKSSLARPLWLGGAAVLTALVLVAIGVHTMRSDVLVYTTQTGEWHAFTLPDGSEVSLNTRSRLEWQPCQGERCVTLVHGEAYFRVVKNPLRPFVVRLGQDRDAVIRVTGTEFDVRQHGDNAETDITVASGAVEVSGQGRGGSGAWKRELRADQQLSVRAGGIVAETHSASAISTSAWRRGTLDINGTVSSAACRLAEYLDSPVYLDKTVTEYQLRARFDLRDATKALVTLESSHLAVDRYKGGYLVHGRGGAVDDVHLERCR